MDSFDAYLQHWEWNHECSTRDYCRETILHPQTEPLIRDRNTENSQIWRWPSPQWLAALSSREKSWFLSSPWFETAHKLPPRYNWNYHAEIWTPKMNVINCSKNILIVSYFSGSNKNLAILAVINGQSVDVVKQVNVGAFAIPDHKLFSWKWIIIRSQKSFNLEQGFLPLIVPGIRPTSVPPITFSIIYCAESKLSALFLSQE